MESWRGAILAVFLLLGLSLSGYADVSDGLVAYYPFNGNANDESGNGNDGIVYSTALAADRFGNPDSAFAFCGDNSYIRVSDSPSLNPSELSISLWIKISLETSYHMDIISKDGETFERQYILSRSSSGKFRVSVGKQDGSLYYYDGTTTSLPGTWYQVVLTYDGNELKLYVDGQYEQPVQSGCAEGGVVESAQPVRIGGGAPLRQNQLWLSGVLDEIRIYNRALSEIEISELYRTTTSEVGTEDGFSSNVQEPSQVFEPLPDYEKSLLSVTLDRFLTKYRNSNMWMLLAVIAGNALLISGLIAGMIQTLQKVYGLSSPLLVVNPEKKYDVGILPIVILKTGIFSSVGVWAAFLLKIGDADDATILAGIGIGFALALVHTLLVLIMQRSKRKSFLAFGLLVGMLIGEIFGMIIARMIGFYASELLDFGIFLLVCMLVGGIIGAVNGGEMSKVFPGRILSDIIAEIAAGGILMAIAGIVFFTFLFNMFEGVMDAFDIFMFIFAPVIVGCLLSVLILRINVVVLAVRHVVSMVIVFVFRLFRVAQPNPLFSTKLLVVILVIGSFIVPPIAITGAVEFFYNDSVKWVIMSGEGKYDEARSIQPTPDGGYIVAGKKDRSIWVFKLSQQGKLVWEHSFQECFDGNISVVRTTLDGGFIIVGNRRGDGWVAKVDAGGRQVWKRAFGVGCCNDEVYTIQLTPDGEYIIGGSISSKGRGSDGWIFKLDKQGKQVWEYVSVQEGSGRVHALQPMPDGSVIVAGIFHSRSTGKEEVWGVKLDERGQKVWEHVFDYSSSKDISTVQVASDGGVLVAGYTWTVEGNEPKIWIVKLDIQGNQVWERTFDKFGNKGISGIRMVPSMGYMLSGNMQGKVLVGGSFWRYQQNAWFLMLNTQGEPVSEYTLDSDNWIYANLYVQSGQLWEYVFHASDFLFKKCNISRAPDRKMGYPIGYPFRVWGNGIHDVQITPDGSIIMAGFLEFEKYKGYERRKEKDAWVAKYTPESLWGK